MSLRAWSLLLALLLPVSGTLRAQDRLFRDERPAMGTRFAVSIYAPDASTAQAALEVAFEEIERIEQLLSDYRSTSELSRVNREAFDAPVTVDPELFALLTRVKRLSRETSGAFDPAVGALVDAWGFRSGSPSLPPVDRLEEARSRSGMGLVHLDSLSRTVRFAVRGVRLDPGAFGKGFAADRAAEILRSSGVERALVNAGASTFRALSPPPGEAGWVVTIHGDTTWIRDAGLSISGQDRRHFESGGASWGHILDPGTGRPAPAGRLSVVLAPDATLADALSTALYVEGPAGAAGAVTGRAGISALVLPAPSDHAAAFRLRWPSTPHDTEP